MSALVKLIKEQSVFHAEETMYVSNPLLLHQLLKALSLLILYDPILSRGKANVFEGPTKANSGRLAEVQRLKIAYCLSGTKEDEEECKSLLEGITEIKANARELVIYPFATQYRGENGHLAEKPLLDSQIASDIPPGSPGANIGKSRSTVSSSQIL